MRTYRIHGIEHEVNEEKFSYNTTTEMNTDATLRDIKSLVSSTRSFKKSPGTVYLRSCGNLVAAATTAGCRMEVYDNGFAIYQTPDTAAVLRMEYVGLQWYEGDAELERCAQTVDLADTAWVVAVMMKGEDRLEKWRGQRDADTLVSLWDMGAMDEETGEPMEYELDAGVDVEEEVLDGLTVETVMGCLTWKQKEALHLCYGEGRTLDEAADLLRVNRRSVTYRIEGAKKKIRKLKISLK